MASGDWRTIDDKKEKYQAYLCSREWGVLREAVRERAEGLCERCRMLPMDATHHLTYARQYKEELEDLQGTCNYCHEFTHGKSDFDPSEHKAWLGYLQHCAGTGKKAFCKEAFHYPRFQCKNGGYFLALDMLMRESDKLDGINEDTGIDSVPLATIANQVRDSIYCICSTVDFGFEAAWWFIKGKPRVPVKFYDLTLKITGATPATFDDIAG